MQSAGPVLYTRYGFNTVVVSPSEIEKVTMDVRVSQLGNAPLVEAHGDIDHNNCGSVEAALSSALDEGNVMVLLDLRDVSYIDSGGLSVLLSGVRRLRDRGWLGAVGPNSNVRRLLEIVGLLVDPNFRVFGDLDEAETAVAQPTAS
jgi:anti-sigma B factor antagonist